METLLLSALVALAPALEPQKRPRLQKAKPSHEGFWAVLDRNFDVWDADHNGILSRQETDVLVSNPRIRGADAAALGALKTAQRAKKWDEIVWSRANLVPCCVNLSG